MAGPPKSRARQPDTTKRIEEELQALQQKQQSEQSELARQQQSERQKFWSGHGALRGSQTPAPYRTPFSESPSIAVPRTPEKSAISNIEVVDLTGEHDSSPFKTAESLEYFQQHFSPSAPGVPATPQSNSPASISRKKALQSDQEPEITLSQFRNQQNDRSNILRRPPTLARNSSLHALETQKEAGRFVSDILYNDRSQYLHPAIGNVLSTPDRDFVHNSTQLQTPEQSLPCVLGLDPNPLGQPLPFKIPQVPSTPRRSSTFHPSSTPPSPSRSIQTPARVIPKRKHIDLDASSDSDLDIPPSPSPNPAALRLTREPRAPRTPKPKNQSSLPSTPRAPRPKRFKSSSVSSPGSPTPYKTPQRQPSTTPAHFVSSVSALQANRSRRRAGQVAGQKVRNIAVVEQETRKELRAVESRQGVRGIGRGIREMSLVDEGEDGDGSGVNMDWDVASRIGEVEFARRFYGDDGNEEWVGE